MGQIQSSLNQLFASTIGASLAASHSPYFQAQKGIKQADQKVKLFEKAEDILLGKRNEETGAREGGHFQSVMAGINNATNLDELKVMLKTEMPKFYDNLSRYYAGADKADRDLAKAKTHPGATKKQQEEGREAGVGFEIISPESTVERRTGRVMRKLGEAYMKKRSLLKAVPERTQMIEDFSNYKGGGMA